MTETLREDRKPSQYAEHVVRYDENGNAVAVVYFSPSDVAPEHVLDFAIVLPDGIVNPSTDRVLATIEKPDEASIEVQGFLKWDGCMNFDIGSGIDGCLAHVCGTTSLRTLFDNVAFVYTLGPRIPAWDGHSEG